MNPSPHATTPASHLRKDVLIALSFLAVAAALPLLTPAHLPLKQRILGIMAGMVVVYYANAVPKVLTPLAKLKNPAQTEALQRFTAWSLVLGGLGHTLAWIVVPFDYVVPVAVTVLGASLLIALGRCLWVKRLA